MNSLPMTEKFSAPYPQLDPWFGDLVAYAGQMRYAYSYLEHTKILQKTNRGPQVIPMAPLKNLSTNFEWPAQQSLYEF